MYILGIHIGHESSAALIKNGNIIGAIQEERFDRIKNSSNFPTNSINFLLNKEKIDKNDISLIACPGNSLGKELSHHILEGRLGNRKTNKYFYWTKLFLAYFLNSNFLRKEIYSKVKTERILVNYIRSLGFEDTEIKFLDHHLCHAASAYYSSQFDQSIIVTQDGKGDGSSGTVHLGVGKKIEEVSRQSDGDSIGQFYAEVTRFLGFKPNRHEGKITGLAAYGSPNGLIEKFRLLVSSSSPMIKRSDVLNNINDWEKDISLSDKIKLYSCHPELFKYNSSSFKFHKWMNNNFKNIKREDLSAAIQQAVEEWTVSLCEYHLKRNRGQGIKNVVLAGGLFANVKINQKIFEINEVEKIFIQPAMGDSGLALGAAQYMWNINNSTGEKNNSFSDAYLGKEYSNEYVANLLSSHKNEFTFEKLSNIEYRIANFINDGFIVGNFQGRSEWGPRALGNRSILIRASEKNINDIVNKRLNRSEFMPFAPSVIDYRAKDYFINYKENHIAAEFMTITYKVFFEKINEIQAVVHVDETARPQVVTKKNNERYYKILYEYEKMSGIGCIVNTSFNLHEEPIIESPNDALRALRQGAVDVLIINDFVIRLV